MEPKFKVGDVVFIRGSEHVPMVVTHVIRDGDDTRIQVFWLDHDRRGTQLGDGTFYASLSEACFDLVEGR